MGTLTVLEKASGHGCGAVSVDTGLAEARKQLEAGAVVFDAESHGLKHDHRRSTKTDKCMRSSGTAHVA
jgi:hypothetical protein